MEGRIGSDERGRRMCVSEEIETKKKRFMDQPTEGMKRTGAGR